MTDDIVTRLRNKRAWDLGKLDEMDEAADEIERLRAELAAADAQIKELDAECEKLTAELAAERENVSVARQSLYEVCEQRNKALAEFANMKVREGELVKMVAENRERPDTLRADKAEAERDALRAALREAAEKLQPISALVDMTPSGFPDHDICPIRLGMARDLRELRARIDAALKGDGDE